MFKPRTFKLSADEIVQRLERPMGSGIASDRIMVDGLRVGFMYREPPEGDVSSDSGWRFLSGEESQDYVDDSNNLAIYDLNTIANYDPSIIPYLQAPVGAQLERIESTNEFRQC